MQLILREHGLRALPRLAKRLPGSVREAAQAGLEKLRTCRTPEGGFVRLRCEQCGHLRTGYFTCKSRLCPSCGWLHAQRLVESLRARLIKGRYRHIVFCVPSELRDLFFWRRELLPLVCHAAAAATMECYATKCLPHKLVPGIDATCHTFGSNLRFHVHVHLLVTEGGLQVGGKWQPMRFFPGREYRKRWQYHLLTKLKQALPADDPWLPKTGRLFRTHPTGFIVNLETSYNNVRAALSYCCRYIARPPISDRRILSYDGKHVVFEYKDYKSGGQTRQERCTAYRFVFLLLQHTLPSYARNIHYYGLFRTQAWRKWYDQARKASRYPQNIVSGNAKPLSWRERIIQTFNEDPVDCPQCGTQMVIHEVRPPPRRYPPGTRPTQRQQLLQLQLALT